MRTRLTDLVGVRYPIVQTGMGYVAGARLTAATANAGGLGIIASATMNLEQLRLAIDEVQERTDKPFGVNLRADADDAVERIDLLIGKGVKVASFALAPKRELIERLKDAGVVVIPSIGARRHAEKVAQWGADAVIVQGGEGGGHTGSVPTTLLLPQVVDAVDIPVVAAGGFFDGRGLVAALAYGAAGIAMGTRFLLTSDSPVGDAVKQVYLAKSLSETVVTTRVDGVPHRVLKTPFIDGLERAGRFSGLVGALRNAAAFRKLSGMSIGQM
ncbi:MAG TPA: 2-nitropropane dioxygenase, partial [Micromonosporaceae bacterium]|nr:2-nitropropane dioxygenase [Micromonosporaceae bacterium]